MRSIFLAPDRLEAGSRRRPSRIDDHQEMRFHCPGSFTNAGRKPLVEQRVKSCARRLTVTDATSCRSTRSTGVALNPALRDRRCITVGQTPARDPVNSSLGS
ncbi:MAG: hypothetical protein L0226_03670 [Acidobacteria bacterium]|nr:hypothetical protein [Acidobacteriota bacterium]